MEVEPAADPPQFETYRNQCLENGKKMYLNANTGDVRFLFGGKNNITAIPAHKAILATDSDVFERMFYGEMKEPGDIHVPDSTAAAFMEFLQYFYLTEVKLTAENTVDVLYLGAKYNIKKCVNNCVQSLVRTLDDENLLDQLGLAIMYDQREWIRVCEKRIKERTDLLFDSVEFLECDKMVLAHILKMDELACTEMDVFKACMSWVKAKCDCADLSMELVERHLGQSFYDIRLASLTMDQLCSLHTQYESVLARDFIHVTNIITLPEFQDPKFKKHPRHANWEEETIIKCKRVINEDEEPRRHRRYHNEHEIVCAYLERAILYNEKWQIGEFEKHIMLNTEAVFNSDRFLVCDKPVLAHILKMDVLSCSEVVVFKACMSWVKAQCDDTDPSIELVELHLGELYNEIRLTSLTLDQLCALQKQYESVLTRDFAAITKMIVQPQLHAPKFNSVPRHAKWNADAIIECDCVMREGDDDYIDNFHNGYYDDYNDSLSDTEVVEFSVNNPLILGTLRINKFIDYNCTHPKELWTELKIVEVTNDSYDAISKILSTMKIQLKFDDAMDISLPHPVLIRPEFVYQICIGPGLGRWYCDPTYLAEERHLEPDTIVEFRRDSYDQMTLLTTMYFNEIE